MNLSMCRGPRFEVHTMGGWGAGSGDISSYLKQSRKVCYAWAFFQEASKQLLSLMQHNCNVTEYD